MPKSKIAPKVVEELNRQFNQELGAAHSYLALSLWCDVRNLKGFGKYFVKQAGEERAHAERILKHMTDRGVTAEVGALPAPKQDFKTLLEVALQAQAQEHANTLGVNAVYEADLFRSSQSGDDSAWARPYLFALAASLVAVAVEFAVDRATSEPIFPFLPGFAAIMVCAVWAGPNSSLASTVLLTLWAVIDLLYFHGRSTTNTIIRCLLFAGEGGLVTAGTARLRRFARESARGEAWHRKLVETAAEEIWVLDNKGTIVWANARMAEMLGISAALLVGHNAEEFYFPADLSVERIRRENLRTGLKEQFDRRLRRGDGAELWVLACCNLTTLESNDIPGSLAMMTDITERKLAEHNLRRSEERFRTLFENVLEGVYQSTPEGRILAANPMLVKMLGLESARDLEDVNIAEDLYVDRDIRKRLLDHLEHEGGFQNVEYDCAAVTARSSPFSKMRAWCATRPDRSFTTKAR